MLPAIDLSSLSLPVSSAELAAQRQRDRAAARTNRGRMFAVAIGLGAFGIGFLAMVAYGIIAALDTGWTFTFAILAAWAAFAAIVVARLASLPAATGEPAKAEARLHRLAALNGLEYEPNVEPRLPGHLFERVGGRRRNSRFTTTSGRTVEVGNLLYPQARHGLSVSVTIRAGGVASTTADDGSYWRYVAVQLDAPLPHMVLEPQTRQTDVTADAPTDRRAFPVDFDDDQHLSLEGDFDRYFRLFVPKEYERDALYVFTPDLMAAMIDEAPGMHIEIVDDWVIFSRNGRADFASASTWAAIDRTANRAASRIVERGGRYRDERTAAGTPTAGREPVLRTVAPAGRRLER
ncbi:hypothetical protein [Agromyces cerinus]|uniref:DUF3137 domain-containing protein n=1 Tax=Agromyces cerinus subsp. cerinus TaxID=232089 RepID=A0A1N6HAN4_9MICO|nr:hypothetical protein [Agromyces cerinus]SIO16826.1 hypothetical protein SAMN05443544_3030 [Agromyces cerinus subsp. cerinus]